MEIICQNSMNGYEIVLEQYKVNRSEFIKWLTKNDMDILVALALFVTLNFKSGELFLTLIFY